MNPVWLSLRLLRREPFVAAALVLALLGASCAYFNTLYNAKDKYKAAVKKPRTDDDKPNPQAVAEFDQVIAKCQTMIGTWPKSRHVDDAMLLIANCLYRQDRFGEAVAQIDSLEIAYPKTNLLPQARLLKGIALAKWGAHDESIAVLSEHIERWPDSDGRPEALYHLTMSAISTRRYEDAVGYVDELESRHEGSRFRFDAQVEAAALLAEQGLFDRSLEIYETLNQDRLPVALRYQVWMGLAEVYVETGRPEDALATLQDLQSTTLNARTEPPALLLKGAAYESMDSTDAAIATYADITKRFSRGFFAATAYYRLGQIFEAADSLSRAKSLYETVARAHAGSEHAEDAIRRAGNITKLMKLAESEDKGGGKAKALRQFMLAELQFTQFGQPRKAVETYEALLADFPESEFGPQAAYAVGYIYGLVLGDSARAHDAYDLLHSLYPESQQARFAYLFVPSMDAPAPVDSAAAATLPGRRPTRADSAAAAVFLDAPPERADSAATRTPPRTRPARPDSSAAGESRGAGSTEDSTKSERGGSG